MNINIYDIIQYLPVGKEKKEALEFESSGNLKMYLALYGANNGSVKSEGKYLEIKEVKEPYKTMILNSSVINDNQNEDGGNYGS